MDIELQSEVSKGKTSYSVNGTMYSNKKIKNKN